ncbi:hypothetical protein [Viscerimonas tarda]
MKKKIFGSLAILAIAAVTVLNVNLAFTKDQKINMNLAELDAQAWDIGEWWDRPDYDCEPFTCVFPFASWDITISKYVGAGAGSQPHSWCCINECVNNSNYNNY